mmetsp:Transcript_19595/g.54651  ORF Transcript_19595/g.54651 Transcript_19595/m.54651 type:complete len:482 (+) Transcript_19595:953-2398(+)
MARYSHQQFVSPGSIRFRQWSRPKSSCRRWEQRCWLRQQGTECPPSRDQSRHQQALVVLPRDLERSARARHSTSHEDSGPPLRRPEPIVVRFVVHCGCRFVVVRPARVPPTRRGSDPHCRSIETKHGPAGRSGGHPDRSTPQGNAVPALTAARVVPVLCGPAANRHVRDERPALWKGSHQPGHPAAAGGRGADHPLQPPAADRRQETGAGPRRRQLRRPQTERASPRQRRGTGAAVLGCRAPGGGPERRAGGQGGGSRSGGRCPDSQGRLYGGAQGGSRHWDLGRAQHRQDDPGTGGQGPHDRLCSCQGESREQARGVAREEAAPASVFGGKHHHHHRGSRTRGRARETGRLPGSHRQRLRVRGLYRFGTDLHRRNAASGPEGNLFGRVPKTETQDRNRHSEGGHGRSLCHDHDLWSDDPEIANGAGALHRDGMHDGKQSLGIALRREALPGIQRRRGSPERRKLVRAHPRCLSARRHGNR